MSASISIQNTFLQASFWERVKFASGYTTDQSIKEMVHKLEMINFLPAKDLTCLRDRIHDAEYIYSSAQSEVQKQSKQRTELINRSSWLMQQVYHLANWIFRNMYKPAVLPDISLINAGIRDMIRGDIQWGLKIGEVSLEGTAYKIYAMPFQGMINSAGFETVSGEDLRIFVLDENNNRRGEMKLCRMYQGAAGGYFDQFYESQAANQNIKSRYLNVFWMEDYKTNAKTRPVMRILTQVAMEIFKRDKDTKLVASANNDSSYVQFQAGFVSPLWNHLKEEYIKNLLSKNGIEQTEYPPYKDEGSFPLEMTKQDKGDTEFPRMMGSWRQEWAGQRINTWEKIIQKAPILHGHGPVLPEYWNADPMKQQ